MEELNEEITQSHLEATKKLWREHKTYTNLSHHTQQSMINRRKLLQQEILNQQDLKKKRYFKKLEKRFEKTQ